MTQLAEFCGFGGCRTNHRMLKFFRNIFVSMFFIFGGMCVANADFTVTTTSAMTGNFVFYITAQGSFGVNCGSGGTLRDSRNNTISSPITKNNTTATEYRCSYKGSSAVRTITFSGAATAYDTVGPDAAINFNNNTYVAAVAGDMSSVFPDLGSSAGQYPVFKGAFSSCTNLTSVDSGLFSGYTVGRPGMFFGTFMSTGLTAIPSGLFASFTTAANSMFYQTFNSCTSLDGYIPADLFAGLTLNNHPNATNFMTDIFDGDTGLDTSCPSGTTSVTTGYESYFGSYVACAESSTVSYDCGAGSGNAPANTTATFRSSFTPASGSGCTAPAGFGSFAGWAIADKYIVAAGTPFTWDFTGDVTLVAQYTPTNTFNLTASITNRDRDRVEFKLSADGVFSVDCGSGGHLSGELGVAGKMIDHSGDSGSYTYTCTYSTTGTKTITVGGLATAYNEGGEPGIYFAGQSIITAVAGNMSAVFPYYGDRMGQYPMYMGTFASCDNLTSVAGTLFSNYTRAGDHMFNSTFALAGLTTIPSELFSGITSGGQYAFMGTFMACTGLTSLPTTLFAGLRSGADEMFQNTFMYCENLTGYVPATMFEGLVLSGTPDYSDFMGYMFDGDTLMATSCPAGTTRYLGTEAYEDNYWIGPGPTSCISTSPMTVTYNCNTSAGGSGSAPSSTTISYGSDFTPAANTCTAPSGQSFIGWKVGDTGDIVQPGNTFQWVYAGNKTFTAQYAKFAVMANMDSGSGLDGIEFRLTAAGTFTVDCGVGGVLYDSNDNIISNNTITRTANGYDAYVCKYSFDGEKVIKFGGTATAYEGNTAIGFGSSPFIYAVTGNLPSLFPYLGSGSGQYPTFNAAFEGCENLSYISSNLFSGYTVGSPGMFANTFALCTGLTSLPSGLFSTITSVGEGTFYGTFYRASNLSGYIPSDMFAGLVAITPRPYATNAMTDIFASTGLATSCPAGTAQYTTGYESYWSSKVSCMDGYTVTYSCGTAGGTPPANATATPGASFTPAANSCTVPTGHTFAGWTVSNTGSPATVVSSAFTWNYNEGKTLTAKFNPETYNVTYSCGAGTGTVSATTATYDASFTPAAANSCTAPTGQTFVGWAVSGDGSIKTAGTGFTWNYTSAQTLTAMYKAFSIGTTSIAVNGTFTFTMSAIGTFYVDCGEGGVLSGTGVSGKTITRSDTTLANYTCTYSQASSAGTKTIWFGGLATQYSTDSSGASPIGFNQNTKVASASGNMWAMFPVLGTSNASQYPRFDNTFFDCSNLTTITASLFNGYTTGVPYMFKFAFSECTSLTSLPAGLFSGITNAAEGMFLDTFNMCTGLTGYVPTDMFAGLVANNSPTATDMMRNVFKSTSLATSCSSYNGMGQYITGYESDWDDRVSCDTGYAVTYSCGTTGGTPPASAIAVNKFTPATNTCTVPTGYSGFAGWEVSNTGATPDVKAAGVQFNWTYTEAKTFTAKLTPQNYNVTYSCGAGSGTISGTTATYGTSFTPAAGSGCTVPSGYSAFAGWAVSGTNDVISSATTWNYTENKTLTATYTPATYTVTYICTGCNLIPEPETATYGTSFVPTTSGSKLGYTLVGWEVSNTGATPDVKTPGTGFTWNYTENKTFTSVWEPNTTTITYSCGTDASGNAPSSDTATFGQSFMFAANNTCGKTGYRFKGWSCSGLNGVQMPGANLPSGYTQLGYVQSSGTQWIDTGFTFTGDVARYELTYSLPSAQNGVSLFGASDNNTKWTGVPYYSSSNTKALYIGTSGSLDSDTDTINQKYGYYITVDRVNSIYTKERWFLSYSQGPGVPAVLSTDSFNGSITSTVPVALFAHNLGSTRVQYSSYKNYGFRIIQDDVLVHNFVPAKNSSNVIGMYDTVTGTFKTNQGNGTFTSGNPDNWSYVGSTLSCEAAYEQIGYSVSFAPGSGGGVAATGTMDAQTAKHYQDTITLPSNGFTAPSGYAFNGWNCGNSIGNKAVGATFSMPNSDVICTAQWTAATYNVTYSCGDGSGTISGTTATYGTSFTPAAGTGCTAPTGHTFAGWAVSGTNDVISSATTWNYAGDKTLTATYTANTYNVTYSCGDGTGTVSGTTATYGTSFAPAAANSCTRSGYTFGGWEVSNTGATPDVKPAGTGFTWNYTEDKTFTAKWTPNASNITYSCGVGTGTVSGTTATYGTSFTPAAANSCTAPSGQTFAGWAVSGDGAIKAAGTGFTWNYIGDQTLTAQYKAFSVTVTGDFSFKMSAIGTFYVDCGEGMTLSGNGVSGKTITRATTTEEQYTCTRSSGGFPKTIWFGGIATEYNTGTGANNMKSPINFNRDGSASVGGIKDRLTSISGNMSAVFPYYGTSDSQHPRFYRAFYGCHNLTTIPDTLFSSYTNVGSQTFVNTFERSGLTAIPSGLFSTITNSASALFESTFAYCTGLTSIPSGLFNSITNSAERLFWATFVGCTGLAPTAANNYTPIPANLFSGITTGATNMFQSTFSACTGLTSIPSGLFSNITTGATGMFLSTFSGCTGLAPTQSNPDPIPNNLFSGITAVSGSMFQGTFQNCTGLTSLPTTLFANITSADSAYGAFIQTFAGCTGLTGYVPPTLFAGLIANNSPLPSMMNNIFNGDTNLDENCDAYTGMEEYTTGYEDYWSSKVSCRLAPYTVTYSCGDGSGTVVAGSATYGLSFTPAAANSCTAPTGHTFAGWEVSNTGATPDVKAAGVQFNWTYTEAKTFTATYTPATYNVTYSCGTGSGTIAGTTATYGSSFTPNSGSGCTAPTGYEFVGWAIDGSTVWNGATPSFTWNYAGDKTLTAVYDLSDMDFDYDCGDGDGNPPASGTVQYGASFTPASSTCTAPTGYTFAGWAVSGTDPVEVKPAGVSFTWNYTQGKLLTATYTQATYTVTYDCGVGSGTVANGSATYGSSFTPAAANSCTAPTGQTFVGWAVSGDGSIKTAGTGFTWNYTSGQTLTAQYRGFSITTTAIGASPDNTFTFTMTAKGTFYVDCGEGGVLSSSANDVTGNNIISRDNKTEATYTCTYPAAGTTSKTIWFGGRPNNTSGYSTGTSSSSKAAIGFEGNTYVKSVSGNISAVFPHNSSTNGYYPRFYRMFKGCTNLETIAGTLFSNYTSGGSYMFHSTFYGCTSLQSIPSTLFENITSGGSYMFDLTFSGCTSLTTIPSGLFNMSSTSSTSYMFASTFSGCSGLAPTAENNYTPIPANLFSTISTSGTHMFDSTFKNCTGLKSIPSGLFSSFTNGGANNMFDSIFLGCTGLAPTQSNPNPIPANLFSTITTSGTYLFRNAFYGCTGLTSLPAGLFSGITTDADYQFFQAFRGCTGLTGYIPPDMFAGLIANGSPNSATRMMDDIFNGDTGLAQSCRSFNKGQYFTGYESKWSTRVSCDDGDTVTYSCGDAAGTPPESIIIVNKMTPATNTCTVPSGYSAFAGWAVSGTDPVEVKPAGTQFDWTYNGDKTFTATFTPNTYNVTYSCGDGSGTVSGTTATYGTSFTPDSGSGCTAPTGYSAFAGWAVSGTNDVISSATTWNYAGDKTLTATYTPNTYTVTYSCGDGSGTISGTTATYNASFTPDSGSGCTAPAGYSAFAGWEVSDSGTPADVVSSEFTWAYTGNKTLTATYTPATYAVAYSCGVGTGTVSGTTVTYGSSFTPAAGSGCTAPSGQTFAGWTLGGTVVSDGSAFTWNFVGNKILTAVYKAFSIGTSSIAVDGTFTFKMSAQGTFYVDCGEGGVLSGSGVSGKNTIVRSGTTAATYTCTYSQASSAGAKTIWFGGLANGYNTQQYQPVAAISFDHNDSIVSVSGNISAMLPYLGAGSAQIPVFYHSFQDCHNLASIDSNLFSGYTTGRDSMFDGTFWRCTSLTSIPSGLFSNITTGASYMFNATFRGCTSLAPTQQNPNPIPANLFSGITSGQQGMFMGTFQDCTGLTAVPSGLFANITTAASSMFQSTFSGCTGLTGYIPKNLFAGLIANNSPTATSMMLSTFSNTGSLATSCGSFTGMHQYITGYESYWDSHVSCWDTYAITYSCGISSSSAPASTTVDYGNSFTPAASNSCSVPTGYSAFAGWEVSNTGTPADVVSSAFTWNYREDKTLTATFTPIYYTASYSCGVGTGTMNGAPVAYDSLFTPATNSCTAPTGQTFVGWAIDGTVVSDGSAFTWNYTGNKTLTAMYKSFSIGTTSIAANGTFTFTMSAKGTFYVDCGEGGVLSGSGVTGNNTIVRSGTTEATYTCTYSQASSAGAKTIWFGGKASSSGPYNTVISTSSKAAIGFEGNTYVKSVSGNISAVFPAYSYNNGYYPRFVKSFKDCTNLETIDGSMFSGYERGAYMFFATFQGCTSLTSIPSGLFADITASASYMFQSTFQGCTGLAPTQQNPNPIPSNLFSGITSGNIGMFMSTFQGCTGLTSIPSGLFANITTGAEELFIQTFQACTGLTGYIPKNLFAGLIANNSPTETRMMLHTFYNTGSLATSCGSFTGMHQYITGYEDDWDSHVSCWDTYTITYDCGNGGGNAPVVATVNYGDSFTPASNSCTAPGNGYGSFQGWAVSGTNDHKQPNTSFAWNYTDDKTFTADYPANHINVNWKNYQGTTTTANSCDYGGTVTVPEHSTRNGYTFGGWRAQ